MNRTIVISLLLLLWNFSSYAAKIEVITTQSEVMNKPIKATIITPDSYNNTKKFPVVYLLHGYGDNYSAWTERTKGLDKMADHYEVIVVCPDGGRDSWYWDSPVDKSYQYETYIAKELVDHIDKNYKTIKSKGARAITGLSMGGHGALYLGIKHQDVFGAAGSMSGGVDIRPFPNNWGMKKWLGEYADNNKNWEEHTVINLIHLINPNDFKLAIECGVDDFFYQVNKALHEKLLYNNIPHDFTIRPGRHTWPYWDNAIKYQMLFFSNFFNGN